MDSDFSFVTIYSLAEQFLSVIEGLSDFFFEYRSFSFSISPVTDALLEQFGVRLIFMEGSLASMLIGVGLPSLLGFKFIKFLLDTLF